MTAAPHRRSAAPRVMLVLPVASAGSCLLRSLRSWIAREGESKGGGDEGGILRPCTRHHGEVVARPPSVLIRGEMLIKHRGEPRRRPMPS